MLEWLRPLSNTGVPGVQGVKRQKSATFDGAPADVAGFPGVPEHPARTLGTPAGTPDASDKLLQLKQEHAEHPEHREKDEGRWENRVAAWQAGLMSLDPLAPRHGLPLGRWSVLLDDADWLFEHFGGQAARDGWSAADLFGVLPRHDGWGGVADRLGGSRSLVMSADLAFWRRMLTESRDSFARGAGAMPRLTLLSESS